MDRKGPPGPTGPLPGDCNLNTPGTHPGLPDAIQYSTAAATMAPITCATMYGITSPVAQRFPAHSPTVTAGLK